MGKRQKSILSILGVSLIQISIIMTVFGSEQEPAYNRFIVLLCGSLIPSFMVLTYLGRIKSNEFIIGGLLIMAWVLAALWVYPLQLGPWFLLAPLALMIYKAYGPMLTILALSIAALPLGIINFEQIIINSYDVIGYLIASVLVTISLIFVLQDLPRPSDNGQLGHPVRIDHQQFLTLINSIADAVIATDQDRRITVYNGAALSILNVNASLKGKLLDSYLPIMDDRNKVVSLKNVFSKARSVYVTRDFKLVFSDGDSTRLYLSIAKVTASFGEPEEGGYVVILRDITKEKTLEEERDEFISVVSHELRTPTAITEGNISNAILLMEKGAPKQRVVESLQQAHNQSIFLANLINDLATLSRAERGVLTVEPEDIHPMELVEELIADYQQEASSKGLKIINGTTLKHIRPVRTSRLYLREILQNFISNSLKYTDAGTITIKIAQDGTKLRFSVSDTGIGISKSDQKKIFKKFYRSEDYRTRASSGTGLGLYVTQKLATILRGDIVVESALDKGSTFSITIGDYHQSSTAS